MAHFMSHFSDIGFLDFNDDNFIDKTEQLVNKYLNNMREYVTNINGHVNGYIGIFMPNRLDIYYDIFENTVRVDTMSFHHNNNCTIFLNSFEVVDKERKIYRIDYDGFAMNIEVPNNYYVLRYDEKKRYMCQLAMYGESVEVFDTEEDFHKTEYGSTMNHESLLPFGMYEEVKDNSIVLTGIIQKIKVMENPFENKAYLKVKVKCMDYSYNCFLDYDECRNFKVGQIISGYFAVTGKIMERYYGSEYHDIKRKVSKNSPIKNIDDMFIALWNSWDKYTAHPNVRSGWKKYDRCCGQCAITAALVYDMFGGEIRTSI